MTAYLKIENPGICPVEGFTVFGMTMADTSDSEAVIGQFGSGNKHGIAVLLRNQLKPTIYCGTLSLDFSVKSQNMNDGFSNKEFERVYVTYSGKDSLTGKSRSGSEDLGFSVNYGEKEWKNDVNLALREFISNAIDRTVREYGNWDKVVVEIVDEKKVRAKADHTRIFIPLTPEVLNFYNNIGKWFLHFSEPEALNQTVLGKKDRNLGDSRVAVIYRRGVRVREWTNNNTESLFDYNLNNLSIDECRKASDWDVKYYSSIALQKCSNPEFARKYYSHILAGNRWEYSFDTQNHYNADLWKNEFCTVFGPNAVATSVTNDRSDRLKAKGYIPIVMPANIYNVTVVRKDTSVLSNTDLQDIDITEPTQVALDTAREIWNLLLKYNMTSGKDFPVVNGFNKVKDSDIAFLGFYQDEQVYLNNDYCDGGEVTTNFKMVVLEELAHYVTGATDNSRAFQEYFMKLVIRLMGEQPISNTPPVELV